MSRTHQQGLAATRNVLSRSSLTAWQIGMCGFTALAQFYLFGIVLGIRLAANSVEFWFVMQIAMICGLLTAYPVN